jgi:hypothetical protein
VGDPSNVRVGECPDRRATERPHADLLGDDAREGVAWHGADRISRALTRSRPGVHGDRRERDHGDAGGAAVILVTETTTSSAFTDLASIGPQVTVDCNTSRGRVHERSDVPWTRRATGATGFHVDGATTIAVANNGPSMTGMAAG